MIVAITGGTGFIGRKLVQHHIQRGDEVRVLSRRPPCESGLPESVKWYGGDLTASHDLTPFVDGADFLYHCAGEIRNHERMEALHVGGTRKLVAAARHRIGCWVQLSSVGVYGPHQAGRVTEQSPPNPKGVYEITKKCSDDLVGDSGSGGAFEWTILRPSIVFGESMPNQSLFQMIRAIDKGHFFFIGEPGASANYIHVDNVVYALTLCGALPAARGRTYNLSGHATLEIFVKMIAEALGKPPPGLHLPESFARTIARIGKLVTKRFPLTESRIDAMTTRVIYPIDAIEHDLGYQHQVLLPSGVSRLVDFWASQQAMAIR